MNSSDNQTYEIIKRIRTKWCDQTKESRGYFIRFLDGSLNNCSASNLEYCHPRDAFRNPEWKVDWDASLTKKEVDFVRNNLSNFQQLYDK